MELQEYIQLLQSPENVSRENVADFDALLSYAPYCQTARLLKLKALYQSNDIRYEFVLQQSLLFAPARRIYFLLHPRPVEVAKAETSANYFDWLATMERVSEQKGVTLQQLAEQLKEARLRLNATKS